MHRSPLSFFIHSALICLICKHLVGTRYAPGSQHFLLLWPHTLTPMPLLSRWPWAGYLTRVPGMKLEHTANPDFANLRKVNVRCLWDMLADVNSPISFLALLKQRNSSIFSGEYTFPYSSLAGAGCNSNSTRLSRFHVEFKSWQVSWRGMVIFLNVNGSHFQLPFVP